MNNKKSKAESVSLSTVTINQTLISLTPTEHKLRQHDSINW